MKTSVLIVPAAVLATATAVAILAAQAGNRSPTLDRGFVPNTGQINTGHAAEPWSAAPPQQQPPSQEEARAALMMPDDGAPSAGQGSAGQIPGEQLTTGSTSVSTTIAGTTVPSGPIGATTQTMPAKFSTRNDLLDRVPTTAWPLPLNEQQRQQIYKAVMADNSQPAADSDRTQTGEFLVIRSGARSACATPGRGENRRAAGTQIRERQREGSSGAATEWSCRG